MKQAHETRDFRIYYVKLWEEITVGKNYTGRVYLNHFLHIFAAMLFNIIHFCFSFGSIFHASIFSFILLPATRLHNIFQRRQMRALAAATAALA